MNNQKLVQLLGAASGFVGLALVVIVWAYGALAIWRDAGLGREFRSLLDGSADGREYVVSQPTPSKRR